MLVLRILAANAALALVWVGTLAVLGFRPIPLQIGLLVLGLATSSVLATRTLLDRERERGCPGLVLDDGAPTEG
ncbi:hypothetical protein [Mumia zhuanghuii]|uniref:Uncharacterized protein n=1 Tax=Mumia zhuanghuii TaxID=2585211 RepID=A0A5C4MMM5_9ACTN|nr:hypothetical protein [Mumia zhuanghuii]TNC47050.1 hypothetical protein FHE65_10515 [Mumia zhuanghuii]TNC47256.1 hypothetical protein FHE65_10235 [Mumia zhuanghuii]